MITYFILLSIAIIPVILFRNTIGLFLSLLFVCLISSIRYGQGDYFAYLNFFTIAENFSIYDYIETALSWREFIFQKHNLLQNEIGYFLLQKAFSDLGFEAFVAFTTCFFCFASFLFIKEFVAPRYYWLALLTLYNPIIIICYFSAIRQSLACGCFAIALVVFAKTKKIWLAAILVLLGSLFHSSCFLLLPMVLLWKFDFRRIAIFAFIILLFLPLIQPFIHWISRNMLAYDFYLATGNQNSILYSFAFSSLLLSGIFCTNINDKKTSILATFALTIILLRIFSSTFQELYFLNRYSMYYEFCTIAFYPAVLEHKKNAFAYLIILAIIFFLFIRVYFFFDNPGWIGNRHFYYSTIFDKDSFGE